VNVVGGGARSELWCQIVADVLQREVRQAEAPQMTNARGAGIQALAALGHLQWSEVGKLVPMAKTFAPRKEMAALWSERFEQFLLEFKHRRKISKRFLHAH
jgi:xylulokinase